MDVLRMRWDDVWFAHWPADPATVAAALPASFDVDTRDGSAYLGVVGFEMSDIRPRGSPVGLSFPELNLRTYVDGPAGPGVYFFSLDADDPLGVTFARRLFRLPYYRARMDITDDGTEQTFRSRRVHIGAQTAAFEATYRPTGTPTPPEAGSLPTFLTERYRFYVADDDGRPYVGQIAHEPWPLQGLELDIHRNDLFATNGFESPDGDPHTLYSPGIDVTAERLRRV